MKLGGLVGQLGQVARAFGQGLQTKGQGFEKALEQGQSGEIEPGAADAEATPGEARSATAGADATNEDAKPPTTGDHGLPSTASLDGKGLKVDLIA